MQLVNQFRLRTTWPADAPPERVLAKMKEFAETYQARVDSVDPDGIRLRLRYGRNPQVAYRFYAQPNGEVVEVVLENDQRPTSATDIFNVWMTGRHFLEALEAAFERSS